MVKSALYLTNNQIISALLSFGHSYVSLAAMLGHIIAVYSYILMAPVCFHLQGSDKDFETVYEQCVRCCKAFLEQHS